MGRGVRSRELLYIETICACLAGWDRRTMITDLERCPVGEGSLKSIMNTVKNSKAITLRFYLTSVFLKIPTQTILAFKLKLLVLDPVAKIYCASIKVGKLASTSVSA